MQLDVEKRSYYQSVYYYARTLKFVLIYHKGN